MKKSLLFAALLTAGLSVSAQTADNGLTVSVGDGWVFEAERFDQGVSISAISKTGTSGEVDFTKATFSNTVGKNEIFNIRPRTFRECTALTKITLPASLESFMPMAADEFFSTDLKGETDPDTDVRGMTVGKTRVSELGNNTIEKGTSFTINVQVTLDNWTELAQGTRYDYVGGWGSGLLATGDNPAKDAGANQKYIGGFQIWLNQIDNNSGSMQFRYGTNSNQESTTIINGTNEILKTCKGKIDIKIEYNADDKTAKIWVNNTTDTPNNTVSNVNLDAISALSTNVKTGVHMVANITEAGEDVSNAEVDNPFRGCVNLMDFAVENGNKYFSVGGQGALRKNGEVKAYPYGRLFDKYLRLNITNNGTATDNYINSGVHANADGVQLTGGGDERQFTVAQGKTGASLFMFKYFPTTPDLSVSLKDINASYGTTEMWAGGHGNNANQNKWESTGNRDWSAQIGMSVVPERQDVTFNITAKNGNGTYYVTISDNKATLTINKDEATEFAIEFAEFIEVPLTDGYATACLPVAVNAQLTDGQYISNDVTVADGKVVLKPMTDTGSTIAARTPLILSSDKHTTGEVVTFKIADANTPAPAADEAAASSLLKGFSLPCTDLTATDSYGLSGTNFAQTAEIPANSVIIAKPAGVDWAATLAIDSSATSGIKDVEGAASAQPAAIYDLQGRRVSNASKGIYIINGVKTLVK